MIVTERILVDVGLEIVGGNGMIDTRDATLDQRPKPFDAVGVDFATDILFVMVANPEMLVADSGHVVVGRELVSKQHGFPIDIASHERDKGVPFHIGDNCGDDLALPLGGTENLCFALSATPTLAVPHTADIGLVNFNLAREWLVVFVEEGADLLEHSPSRLVGHAQFPFKLLGGNAATGGRHDIDSLKPSPERSRRLVEYRAGKRGHLMPAVVAFVNWSLGKFVMLRYLIADWAFNPVRVAVVLYPLKAGIGVRECLVKVFSRKLFHFFHPSHHVLYHKHYMMSRDNYQI